MAAYWEKHMPYFVRVGAIRSNLSGVGARGYHIFRRKRKVIVRSGAIEVRARARFFWRYVAERAYSFRSERDAMTWLAAEIYRRVALRRYSRLPKGHRISKGLLEP